MTVTPYHVSTEPIELRLCLSRSELFELTGYKQSRKQAESLAHMKVYFRIALNGDIKVLRNDLYSDPVKAKIKQEEPNYESLKIS